MRFVVVSIVAACSWPSRTHHSHVHASPFSTLTPGGDRTGRLVPSCSRHSDAHNPHPEHGKYPCLVFIVFQVAVQNAAVVVGRFHSLGRRRAVQTRQHCFAGNLVRGRLVVVARFASGVLDRHSYLIGRVIFSSHSFLRR